MRLHILGSSGSGTTTLGVAIARHYGWKHFDADDYYWMKTPIPYTQKVEVTKRQQQLLTDLKGLTSWVISGSMDSWSEPFIPLFDLVFFIEASADIRSQRLRARESNNYGDRIQSNGDMFESHQTFIKWAEQYDEGYLSGRSRTRHEAWLKQLTFPVVRFVNESTPDNLLNAAIATINSANRQP